MYKTSPSPPLPCSSPQMEDGVGSSPFALTETLTLMGACGKKQLPCMKMAVLTVGHWVFPVDI